MTDKQTLIEEIVEDMVEKRKNTVELLPGVPRLTNIKKIPDTVILTYSRKEYDELMRIYECAGWKGWNWTDLTHGRYNGKREEKLLPTEQHGWEHQNRTTVLAENDFYNKQLDFVENRYDVINPGEFYFKQGITQEMRDDIYVWFEKWKPNRESKFSY